MYALLISFGVIFVAELGDKSQLLAMTFATRYPPWPVLAAIATATTVVHGISVGIGELIGTNLPTDTIAIVAGVAFLGFAAWTLRGDTLSEDAVNRASRSGRSVFLMVMLAFFVAELGDKTMLATITLATREGWLGTWIGSTLGMVVADALAIAIGAWFGRRLPERAIRYGAAALFAVIGTLMIIDGAL